MVRIAITGQSGSGKGYVCSLLEKMGIASLDCDAVVHRFYASDDFARHLSAVVEANVCHPEGGVDRRALAPVVYGNEAMMKRVQALVYPLVRAECRAFLEEQERAGARAAAVDAPQLFEAGFEEDYQLIICVSAPREERLKRIMKRDGISEKDALLRMSKQMSLEDYEKRCHAVVPNGEKDRPEETLLQILRKYGV